MDQYVILESIRKTERSAVEKDVTSYCSKKRTSPHTQYSAWPVDGVNLDRSCFC